MDYREEIINALGEVCKKARSEGFESAREVYTRQVDSGYKKGLEDAWECAKKVVLPSYEGGLAFDVFEEIFGECGYQRVLKKYKVSEAMQKIKEYEKRQKIENFANVTGYGIKEVSEAVDKIEKQLDQKQDEKIDIRAEYEKYYMPIGEENMRRKREQREQDEKCEKCTKEISAECVVDGCEFESKQTDATDMNDGSIKVGDEVINGCVVGVVTQVRDIANGIKAFSVMDKTGRVWNFNDLVTKRTGRHFPQIAEVLEQLRGEE